MNDQAVQCVAYAHPTRLGVVYDSAALHHVARKKEHNAKENRVSFLISIGVCCSALVLIFVIGYLLFGAGVSASTSVAMRSLSRSMSYYGW